MIRDTKKAPAQPQSGDTLSAKGVRTRDRLLAAARFVFERDGFLEARVGDIASEANVAHGTFYTYFDSKQDIFHAVVAAFRGQIYDRDDPSDTPSPTRIGRIEEGNMRFYQAYLNNLRMFDLYEGAAAYDDDIRQNRINARHQAEARVRRSIERFQDEGLVSAALDAEIAASCLVAMATHSFYSWHVREKREYDRDIALKTLTHLWASALGLRPEQGDDRFYFDLLPPSAPARARKSKSRVPSIER